MPSEAKSNELKTYQLLHIALLDLSQAAFFTDHLLTENWCAEPWEVSWQQYLHQAAYVTAMVVAYSRPFTDSRGWPKFPGRLLRSLNETQRNMHARLMSLRNEVYAHSDIAARKIRPITIDGTPTATEALPPMRFDASELRQVRETIRAISLAIVEKQRELANVLAQAGLLEQLKDDRVMGR